MNQDIVDAVSNNCIKGKPNSVSICIGTYNQAQYLRECIESALAQTYPIQEIWVSDDASTDNTPHLMEAICNQYPIVHYYRQPENLGITGNLSWVLSQPKTDLTLRLDSDDTLERTCVKTLAELMSQYPNAGYAHGNIYEIDENGVRSRTRKLNRTAVYEEAEVAIRRNTIGYRVAANCAILYRSAALREAKYYYPNKSWRFVEDWDLVMRIAILGWGNLHAGTAVANYRVWADTQGARFKRKMWEVSNLIDFYKGTVEPEYVKRNWDTRIIKKCMRRSARGFVDAIDSPAFSVAERSEFKALLRRLGNSRLLSVKIALAEIGLNPVFRTISVGKILLKDLIKSRIRVSD